MISINEDTSSDKKKLQEIIIYHPEVCTNFTSIASMSK